MTFDDLSSYLTSFSNRSDLTTSLAVFVSMAEGEMYALRVRQMVTRADLSIPTEFVDLPADFLAERTVTIGDHDVDFVTLETLDAKSCETTGRPRLYTVDAGKLRFFPAPDKAYSAKITYYAAIPGFTADQSNWIAEGFPNAYRFGVMWASGLKTRDIEAIGIYKAQFDKQLADIAAKFRDKTGRPLRADPSLLQHSNRHWSGL